ncbi:MAG: fatty acyl-AMP ligase [Rhodospirillales bacterium]
MAGERPTVQLTATTNSGLAPRLADFETLTDGLDYAAKGETGYCFFSTRGDPAHALPYAELRERAIDLAHRLSASGLERGSRFAIIAETNPEFAVFFFACQYAGLIPVPLPLSINLGGHDTHVARLRGMLSAARPAAAMASADLVGSLREAAEGLGVAMLGTPDAFRNLSGHGGVLRPFDRDAPCYIQYSSGSTSQPRGVLVTQKAITSNARAIGRHGLGLRPGDRATSWLPLYHDMGLVGFCLTPMLTQVSVDYLATTTFALRPRTWLKVISETGGTISFSPTFGYELCLKRGAKGGGDFDLSSWRIAGIGGEMVRAKVLDEFAATFAEAGFDARAFVPSYGLAEATLAVSFRPIGEGLRVDQVDREVYERTGRAVTAPRNGHAPAQVRSFVTCGRVLPGYGVEIRDDQGRGLPDRTIGRICISGPSLMDGYYRNPEATRQVMLADGWLDTGDMGYLIDGELVVTGRKKDMIICNGRNIWPQDLEWAIENVAGVRSGCVAAFSVADGDDEERVVVVAESSVAEAARQADVMREIAAIIHKSAGVHCEVVLVPARSLTYTSSGKLSRSAAKARYLEGAIRPAPPVPDAFSPHDGEDRLAVAAGE